MVLESINAPADLRHLDDAELETLAREIREFVVQAVSVTGGHLGSNLGVVELTLALHRVYSSPRDILLWDTGHLAYVHKIVTGRRDMFPTLRQAGGLAGYPSRAESVHDWVENSHASTILSYAHGLSAAVARSNAPERRVVAVIGDGSMTGGMAFEGLNNLGHSGSKVVIVLNDNGRSYAPTISRLSESMTKIRLHPGLRQVRSRLEEALRDLPAVGGLAYHSLQGLYSAMREVVEPPAFFESLGVRYVGPIDGHDIAGMEQALRQANEFDGPIVVHVVTQKGRGYGPAETDDEKCLHDAPVFDPAVGPPAGWSSPKGYTQAFNEAMLAAGEDHPTLVAITAAMPGPTGLLPFSHRWPDRFFDVGIAEQHAVTSAAGMAMGGLRPVVAVYSTFFSRAFDQANLDVGLHGLPVVFALDRAGITGDDGPSHHGVLDMALCLKIPGMTIFAPSSAQEVPVMLETALGLSGPSAIRYPKTAARHVEADQVGSGLHARKVRAGDGAVAILAVGKMVEAAEEAAGILAADGVDATVWDVRVVRPLDPEMIADAGRHQLVVTVEDGIRQGGAGTCIADAIADLQETRTGPPVLSLGVPTSYIAHGKPDRILTALGLDGPGIAAATAKTLPRSLLDSLPGADPDAEASAGS
ncbi:1-deoxy-D-xylulose-5-phosphate synthase [Acidiferrimicrobium sp. IK]|uniref:1-deoxy-D-xylulose-5-phosphate synthase n=1 Tax=Acidiferrimicrobium sp. IK TaxID=2871700 RepID=UPI0021CB90D1|nr:1-deoxy-D-xylulose-5-phosphate synthase [Acidiferrimicrobium sp. IK]MCU4185339.1 1-deoxy-D-xylulose-5-phosphate synthase [Acidiferrimicrobium sp. IK]